MQQRMPQRFYQLLIPLLLTLGTIIAEASPSGRLPGLSPLIVSLLVTPSTITFNNTNPDVAPAAQTSLATFVNGIAAGANAWTLGVSATSSTITNCPQIPLSAISITCSSIVVTGITVPNAACSGGGINLSTVPQTIASGQDGPIISVLVSHLATISIAFTDSWKYPGTTGGSSCIVNLTYSLNRN